MPQKQEYLSKNQQIVLSIIEKAKKDHLKPTQYFTMFRKKALKHRMQVYRALEKLIEIEKNTKN